MSQFPNNNQIIFIYQFGWSNNSHPTPNEWRWCSFSQRLKDKGIVYTMDEIVVIIYFATSTQSIN